MTLVVGQGQFLFPVADTAIVIIIMYAVYRTGWNLRMNVFVNAVVKIELYPKMVQMNMYLIYIDDILCGLKLLLTWTDELLHIKNQVLTMPLGSIGPMAFERGLVEYMADSVI
jgi:hypothetical protein